MWYQGELNSNQGIFSAKKVGEHHKREFLELTQQGYTAFSQAFFIDARKKERGFGRIELLSSAKISKKRAVFCVLSFLCVWGFFHKVCTVGFLDHFSLSMFFFLVRKETYFPLVYLDLWRNWKTLKRAATFNKQVPPLLLVKKDVVL